MNLAVQHTLVTGATLKEKFQRAADYGFAGIELAAWGFSGPMADHRQEIEAAAAATGLKVSSLCSMGTDDFAHPDRAEREKRVNGLVRMLQLADDVGARGVVGLPIRKPVQIPDLSPVADEPTLTNQLTVALLQSVIARTPDVKARVFLEPLNRYETNFLRTVAHAADLCRKVGSDRVQIMADMFHMSIEEARVDTALESVASHVGHLHLADSNRLLPGQGHTDFAASFRVMKQTQFQGWFALECSVNGDPDVVLPQAVAFIHTAWDRA